MKDAVAKTYEEQKRMEKEHEDIYKTKKEVLVGVVDEIKPEGKNSLYDILLKIDKKKYCIRFAYDCTYDKELIKVGNIVAVLCSRIAEGIITASIIVPNDKEKIGQLYRFVEAFNKKLNEEPSCEEIDSFEKKQNEFPKNLPSNFYKLDKEVQQSILDQMESSDKYEDGSVIVAPSLSRSECMLKFELCKDTYPIEAQLAIKDLINSYSRNKNSEKLQLVLGINTRYHKETVSAEEMLEKLNSSVYGLNAAKQEVYSAIKTSSRCKENGLKILIVGPPGCGKTELARRIAIYRNKPYIFASCGAFTSLVDTSGCSSVYDNGRAGFFGEAFYRSSGTTDCTVILDEIEKANRDHIGKDGDPNICFLDMLGDEGFYFDQFCQCKISTKNTWFIATANDLDEIKPWIRNRFDIVVHIDGYTDEEKLEIAKQYIIPNLNIKWDINNHQFLTDSQLKYIIKNYCFDYGCRDLKHRLQSIYRRGIELEYDKKKKKFKRTEIDQILSKDNVMNDPIALYRTNRDFFSDNDQSAIEKIISESQLTNDSTGRKEVAIQRLKYIADIVKPRDIKPAFNYKLFEEQVNKSHSGLQELKDIFARILNYYYRTGKAKNLLLIGPPGTGKTTLTSVVAASSGMPCHKVSCNGLNDPNLIKGTASHVHAGTPGKIASALSVTGTKAFIILDEIDKINARTEGGYATMSALLDLLDEKMFHDNYLDIDLNCKGIIFVATANNIENMTPELLDRFEVVNLEGYSKKEKKMIFKNSLLPAVLNENNCSNDEQIVFEDDAIDFMIDHYTETAGARELRTNCEKIVGDILLKGHSLKVSKEDIVKHLGKPTIIRGNRPSHYSAGTVNGLSVNSYSGLGNMFAIECIHSNVDIVTGLAKGSLKESVEIAKAVASSINLDCKDKHYHIHFAEGGIVKDGPSAGVAITLAILSCEYGITIDPSFAYTGEIDLNGFIWAIGGESQKIEAAIECGCTKVFIPQQNYKNMDDDVLEDLSKNIEIVPVSHIEEVLSIVMSNATIKAS